MTFEQKIIFEKLVASLPKLQLRLKEQLGALIKVKAMSLLPEVERDLEKININQQNVVDAPIIVPWRGKYLLIHYSTLTSWDDNQQKNLGMVLINQIIKNVLLEWENDFLEMMIYQDDLTNVFNYRRLCEDLENQLKQDRVFTLAFFDINDLKKINEKHGHYVGSKIIKFIAQKLHCELGTTYHLYRYGGDEFVCLFDQLSTSQVKPALDKVIIALEAQPYLTDQGLSIPMGISVGVAEFPKDGKTMKEIIDLADKMMFCAKKDGKNKVIEQDSNGKKAA